MKAIVAMDENLGIGYQNSIPWRISEDFKWFKETTLNKSIIVGRVTFESLPPLKDRYIKVPTRNLDLLCSLIKGGEYFNPARFWTEKEFKEWSKNDILCGGAQVYKEFLHLCDEIYITHVKGIYECDIFFPLGERELLEMFPHAYHIKTFKGDHMVIKYTKNYE